MIGKKRTRGRIADVAVFAPLVLLPFVWFATAACDELITGGDRPDVNYNPQPPTYYSMSSTGGPGIYNVTGGETRYSPSGGGGDLYCTGGTYVQGGGEQGENSMKADIEGAINRNKRNMRELQREIDDCKGKTVYLRDLQRAKGCNNDRRAYVLNRMNNAFGDELKQLKQEAAQLDAACYAAENEYLASPCNDAAIQTKRSSIGYYQSEIAADEGRLGSLNACINDRKRREAAQRPQVDPALIMQGIQGLGIGRRPSSSGGHSQPPPPAHQKKH